MPHRPSLARRGLIAAGLLALATTAVQAKPLTIPPADIPRLVDQAATAQGFAPAGWALEEQATGDLNGDGRADLALVFHGQDPALIVENRDGLGERRLDTNPRLLALAFAEAGGGYRLALQDAALIGRRIDPVFADPYDKGGISVARGALRLTLVRWASAGSYGAENRSLTFRWQEGRFMLIGYDQSTTQRNTGATEALSVNYSTGRASIETGTIESEATRKRWVTLTQRPLLALPQVGYGLDFRHGVPGVD
ncbi:hypothetical protein [Roseomonas sp. 18066]|uniref:hypothetical protein n=1 Tax=Roseomonas sp. 18066 TaxID=2681412 RepID=UPI00135B1069|nr:hypothetical protein [Roseomonas sp. 18066]